MSRATLELAVLFERETARRARSCPGDHYEPHSIVVRPPGLPGDLGFNRAGKPSGQLQFHQSKHIIRVAAPGNGWGGTTALGCEVDAWMRHTNRWQQTPDWPIRAIWFCPQFRQFDMVRANLVETAIGTVPVFKDSGFGGPRYVWPDGSVMYLCSYDGSWKHVQGVEVDLVAFDEQPPPDLWREMMARRRGKRKTRYICKATQTTGWGWMGDDIYTPWRTFHVEHGLDEEAAMLAQVHPDIWCWPRGGIHDNPAADAGDVAFQETRPWPTTKERKVRLFGGFENWAGDCIFDEAGLDWLRQQAIEAEKKYGRGVNGSFTLKPKQAA